jgi:hypothetical protein
MKSNIIEIAKSETQSYIETTGQEPTLLILSKSNYDKLLKISKYGIVTRFIISGIKLKVITSEHYDENTLYVSR